MADSMGNTASKLTKEQLQCAYIFLVNMLEHINAYGETNAIEGSALYQLTSERGVEDSWIIGALNLIGDDCFLDQEKRIKRGILGQSKTSHFWLENAAPAHVGGASCQPSLETELNDCKMLIDNLHVSKSEFSLASEADVLMQAARNKYKSVVHVLGSGLRKNNLGFMERIQNKIYLHKEKLKSKVDSVEVILLRERVHEPPQISQICSELKEVDLLVKNVQFQLAKLKTIEDKGLVEKVENIIKTVEAAIEEAEETVDRGKM